jgi:hypothetical protein
MPRLLSLSLCLFFSFHLAPAPHCAADDLDHIAFEGTVTDAAGSLLRGASITARHAATGQERSTLSDQQGRYRLAPLPAGAYELRAEFAGFRTLRYQGVSAPAGATVRRDFRLELAQVEEQVTIDAASQQAMVDTSRTVVGGTLVRQQVDALPTESRNIFDLIFTLAGVTPEAFSQRDLAEGDAKDRFASTPEEAGIFALNGGLPFSNNLTIEGLDNNDDRAARERFRPSVDAVEELQIITNQFSAEYGRASGGRVNLRLRGGSNELRGRAFYYFRDESLNANSFVRNSDPTRGFRLPYQNNNVGASLGGPIIRKRAFFFAAYEHDRIHDQADIAALLPTAVNPSFPLPLPNGTNLGSSGVDRNGKPVTVNGGAAVGLYDVHVTTPKVEHTFEARSDLNLGEKHTAFALLTLARNRDERGFPGGRRTLDTLRRTGRNSQSIALADNFTISSRWVSQSRFQFSRLTPADAPPNANPVVIIDIDDPRDVPGNPNANPLTRAGNLTAGASTLSGTDRREDRYQAQQTLNHTRGAHTLRAGADVQVIRSRFVDLEDTSGTFNFDSPAGFLANQPSRYRHRFNTESELRNTYAGLFIQDDWRIRPNLTLAFGLRWDNETIMEDRNNFGPRLAVAWDPFKSGRTVVRAGYGIFFNRALLRTLDDFILTSNTVSLDTNNPAAQPLLAALQFPRVLAANDPRIAQMGVRESGFVRRLEMSFRIPESYQASLGIERELRRGFKFEASYIFNRGLHLWRESNANVPRLPSGFSDFTAYLLSRDFPNPLDPVTKQRPITNTGNADFVRFNLTQTTSSTIKEGNRTIVVFGLNNPSTSNASGGLRAALAAIRDLRPNPQLTQVEELQSRGNSYYHGLNIEVQRRFTQRGFVRAAYTLSKLIDDGVVNTSSPLVAGDFRRERALSLLDARHRLALSGAYHFPAALGRLDLAGVLNLSSSRPFSLGVNGNDRNLNDVNNDRPNFSGDLGAIHWRRPGATLDSALTAAFALPAIGSSGNLPRNAGRGPGAYTLNLRLSRRFDLGERRRLMPQIEVFNPFNSTIFSFGAEFVDFVPSSLGDFLAPARTLKPRTMRVGLRFEF